MTSARDNKRLFTVGHIFLSGALLAGFLYVSARTVKSDPYSYDEADYMFAVSRGARANWLDTTTLSLSQFIDNALTRGSDHKQRSALSKMIRSSDDALFYRHFHGPVLCFWLIGVCSFHNHEHWMRSSMLVFPATTGLLIYFGLLWLLPRSSTGNIAALIGAVLFWGSYFVIASTEVAPHQIFVTLVTAALIAAAKARVESACRWWYCAVIISALAVATLEVAFVLVFVLLGSAWLERDRWHIDKRFVVTSILAFVCMITVVWPAALLRLSFLKAYAFMAYLAVFRDAAWGNHSLLETWALRFQKGSLELLLVPIALIALWKSRAPLTKGAPLFLTFGLIMLGITFGVNGDLPRYLLPFLPALHIFVAIAIAAVLAAYTAKIRIIVVVLTCALRLTDTVRVLSTRSQTADPRPAALLTEIRDFGLENRRLLVPQEDLPSLHYYFPKALLTGYLDPSVSPPEVDAILCTGFPVRITLLPVASVTVERVCSSGAPDLRRANKIEPGDLVHLSHAVGP